LLVRPAATRLATRSSAWVSRISQGTPGSRRRSSRFAQYADPPASPTHPRGCVVSFVIVSLPLPSPLRREAPGRQCAVAVTQTSAKWRIFRATSRCDGHLRHMAPLGCAAVTSADPLAAPPRQLNATRRARTSPGTGDICRAVTSTPHRPRTLRRQRGRRVGSLSRAPGPGVGSTSGSGAMVSHRAGRHLRHTVLALRRRLRFVRIYGRAPPRPHRRR
jgi:hypothetical protein